LVEPARVRRPRERTSFAHSSRRRSAAFLPW
jgi:hypothetical protein